MLTFAFYNKKQQGFTLFEIIVVLFLIGILSAISAPNFLGWYRRSQLDYSLSEVRGALRQAQREAIRRSAICQVTINAEASPVTVTSCVSTRTLPEAVTVGFSGGSTITFGFRGNTNNNNTIHFSSEAVTQQKCLAISMPLGIIREGIYDSSASPRCQKL